MKLIKKALKVFPYLKRHGIRATLKKAWRVLFRKIELVEHYRPEDLEAQKAKIFAQNVKISVLVPLYNTPIKFLDEMIASVQAQTYSNWELCLADGSDAEHDEVGKEVLRLAQADPRIVYRKLEKNLGISENTNACIEMATGDYLALFDHDDLLHPAALYEVMCAICEKGADFIYTDEAVFESPKIKKIIAAHYKPDYGIDTLRSVNYICHLTVFSKALQEKVGGFRREFDGSQDHDMILRLTEQANCIVHIPRVLYYWRSHAASVASGIGAKLYAIKAGQNAVLESVKRAGMNATVESTEGMATFYRVRYEIPNKEKVSIIIPTKNHCADLRKCIHSILQKTTYPNYEIIIVDNGSDEEAIHQYYKTLEGDDRIKVCMYNAPFNYPKVNNFGISHASGAYYLLLNNDIEIITPEWIEEMLMFVQREDVGAAGAMLYYDNNTVQHAGVVVGIGNYAGHAFKGFREFEDHSLGRLHHAQEYSAVTAACMLVKASVYREVGGLDEGFAVACNDVDLCLRIRQAGYLIVWTPFAKAYHYESKTRGYEDTPEKKKRFEGELARFRERWADFLLQGDPYYNKNLTLDREDFTVRDDLPKQK